MNNTKVGYYVEYSIKSKESSKFSIHKERVTKDLYEFYKENLGYEIDNSDHITRIDGVYILNNIDVDEELNEIFNRISHVKKHVNNEIYEEFKSKIIDDLEGLYG